MLSLLKRTLRDFNDDECPVRAAALAYYTIFALPPLLILLILIAGRVWDPVAVQRAMETQFASLVGSEGGRTIHEMLSRAKQSGSGGIVATILGVAGLFFGAIGAFMQLQAALNRAWEVEPDPSQGGLKSFFLKRLLSAGMILGVAFLLIVSLALTTMISALGGTLTFIPEPALHALDVVLSFAVMTVLFAAIFKALPDATVEWRDVWVGAVVTSILFVTGKFVIGLYLGRSQPGSAYGAASTLAVILVWVYYAGMIVLFGAEFTQAWAERAGRLIRPEKGALRARREVSRSGSREPERHTARRSSMERNGSERAGHLGMRDGNGRLALQTNEQSLGELFKRLTADSSHLIQQEISLAKTELRETTIRLSHAASQLGVAVAMALPGALALTAFLVIGLGALIHNYWASALIVGIVLVALASVLAKRALASVKGQIGIPDTAQTLHEDAQWAKEEAKSFKRELTA